MTKKVLLQRIEEVEQKLVHYEKLIKTYGEDYQRWFTILLNYFDLVIDFDARPLKLRKKPKKKKK